MSNFWQISHLHTPSTWRVSKYLCIVPLWIFHNFAIFFFSVFPFQSSNNIEQAKRGPDFCPYIKQNLEEILIPVDVSTGIDIHAANLPEPQVRWYTRREYLTCKYLFRYFVCHNLRFQLYIYRCEQPSRNTCNVGW